MESVRLIPDGGPKSAVWLLEWDDGTTRLTDPDGRTALTVPTTDAHRHVNWFDLFGDEKRVRFTTPAGAMAFHRRRPAVRAAFALAEVGLAASPEGRAALRRQGAWGVPVGLTLFVVCGGLVGAYCWVASWAPDPPPGHWVRWVGWLIHLVLLFLMAGAIAGPCLAVAGYRQWRLARRAERRAARDAAGA